MLYSSSASADCFCLEHGEKTIAKSLFTTYGSAVTPPIVGERAGGRWDVDQLVISAKQVMQHTARLTSRSTSRRVPLSVVLFM